MSRDRVLALLFNQHERTCVGASKFTGSVNPFTTEGAFYCVNPLASVDLDYKKKPYYAYMKPRRADINVKEFRNFVFEIDELSLEDQLKVIEACGIDFSAIIYSGGKSYHCLVCLDFNLGGQHTDNGISAYNLLWARMAAKIDAASASLGLADRVVDSSCKNPSRFTRYPEYHDGGRKRQDVIKCRDVRMTREEFDILISQCPEVEANFGRKRALFAGEVSTMEEFWNKASEGLKNSILYPTWAKASAGLYPEALRIVLWAIDETNIDRDLLIKIFEKRVFRQYEKVAYPQEKWYNAIDDAYNLKG